MVFLSRITIQKRKKSMKNQSEGKFELRNICQGILNIAIFANKDQQFNIEFV